MSSHYSCTFENSVDVFSYNRLMQTKEDHGNSSTVHSGMQAMQARGDLSLYMLRYTKHLSLSSGTKDSISFISGSIKKDIWFILKHNCSLCIYAEIEVYWPERDYILMMDSLLLYIYEKSLVHTVTFCKVKMHLDHQWAKNTKENCQTCYSQTLRNNKVFQFPKSAYSPCHPTSLPSCWSQLPHTSAAPPTWHCRSAASK